MSNQRPTERASFNPMPWVIAIGVLLLVAAVLVFSSHRKPPLPPNALLPLDPDAATLTFSDLKMSESTSLSGGKSTFVDGHVKNVGAKTVSSATVQVLFANEEALPPQVETLPLSLIRTHEPYVDTQPLADAPLAPGDDREFRLIFEGIGGNWNQHFPEIHVVHLTSR